MAFREQSLLLNSGLQVGEIQALRSKNNQHTGGERRRQREFGQQRSVRALLARDVIKPVDDDERSDAVLQKPFACQRQQILELLPTLLQS